MSLIKFKQKGNFSRITSYFERVKEVFKVGELDKYGREGVEALRAATPVDSGKTADSWYYEIENQNGKATISFHNSNVNDNVSIAVILQYGHGTRNGGWVEGRDYINPALQPVFDKIAADAWKEVTKNE
jgi:hypothetical protein